MPKATMPKVKPKKMSAVPTTPCACCGAASLTYSASADPTVRAVAALCAPRWECSCWKVVQCERCKRCLGHCECLSRNVAAKTRMTGNVAVRRAERKRIGEAELPLEMPWRAKEKR